MRSVELKTLTDQLAAIPYLLGTIHCRRCAVGKCADMDHGGWHSAKTTGDPGIHRPIQCAFDVVRARAKEAELAAAQAD